MSDLVEFLRARLARWRARRRVHVLNNGQGFLVVYIDCMPFDVCEGTSTHEPVESIIQRAVDYILTEKPARLWSGRRRGGGSRDRHGDL